MMGRHERTAAVVGALLIVAVVLGGCGSSSSTVSTTEATTISGNTAPDFSGVTLDGVQVSLSAYRGKPVVLVFMASWCGPCQQEAPEIDSFYRQARDKAEVLAMDVNDSQEAIRELVTSNGWTFPVMLNADSAASAYGVRFIPTVVVVDSEGRIAEKIVGGTNASDLSLLIDGLTR
jgi:thiol-disulfide isomerase/thioredoxin